MPALSLQDLCTPHSNKGMSKICFLFEVALIIVQAKTLLKPVFNITIFVLPLMN